MYKLDEYTVSLLHFNEDFKDETGKVWTANGSPVISADQSKFGGKSLYLDGSSYLTTPYSDHFNFGTDDFTIDWWEYRKGTSSANQVILGSSNTNGVLKRVFSIGHSGDITSHGDVTWWMSSNGTTWDIASGRPMGSAIFGAWTHYALVRHSGTFYAFQNGILKDSLNNSSTVFSSDETINIGLYKAAQFFNGYIDELRISKGIARWTENFDPEPVKKNCLLRITMNDSSEREYELSISEVEAFITWCNRTVDTGDAYYVFDKTVGLQNSKEYLFFEKIISFEVIEIS
ncbi:LamG domain-containing protein [Anaerosinus massiliensis]|uniref:LamG domain-containing protein n=1 Tax=Massilibacillus massiliensis TaxID=1806837 RepID=UPI000DA63C15|nr:LamG domain-containing protein [Massilibacillus massiliensis]